MKFIQQLSIILFISFLGEGLNWILPLPIPASVYGLILMLIALQFHIVQLEQVQDTARFFIEIMPVMFIPAGVGLLNSWNVLQPILYSCYFNYITDYHHCNGCHWTSNAANDTERKKEIIHYEYLLRKLFIFWSDY